MDEKSIKKLIDKERHEKNIGYGRKDFESILAEHHKLISKLPSIKENFWKAVDKAIKNTVLKSSKHRKNELAAISFEDIVQFIFRYGCSRTEAIKKAVELAPDKHADFLERANKQWPGHKLDAAFDKTKPSIIEMPVDIKFSLTQICEIGQCLEDLENYYPYKIAAESYHDRLSTAQEVYKKTYKNTENQCTALREASIIMGIYSGKKRSKVFNKQVMLREYKELISGRVSFETATTWEPLDRWDAIKFLKEKYRVGSSDACYTLLKKALSEKKKDAQAAGCSVSGYKNILPRKNVEKYTNSKG